MPPLPRPAKLFNVAAMSGYENDRAQTRPASLTNKGYPPERVDRKRKEEQAIRDE